jgi:hypothetical protein
MVKKSGRESITGSAVGLRVQRCVIVSCVAENVEAVDVRLARKPTDCVG